MLSISTSESRNVQAYLGYQLCCLMYALEHSASNHRQCSGARSSIEAAKQETAQNFVQKEHRKISHTDTRNPAYKTLNSNFDYGTVSFKFLPKREISRIERANDPKPSKVARHRELLAHNCQLPTRYTDLYKESSLSMQATCL